jgi:hypothetical protein
MMRIGGLSLLTATNSPRVWTVAAWHSPHSLTWSWLIHLGAGRPTFKPHWFRHKPWSGLSFGFGTLFSVSAYRDNQGWQGGLGLGGLDFRFQRQEPMWYRDLYIRLRDEQDQRLGLLWVNDNHPHKIHTPKPQPSATHAGGIA